MFFRFVSAAWLLAGFAIHSVASFTVPAVDECVSVNATTPSECPKTIGPPCPPCFTNDRPDYKKGDSLQLNNKTTQELLSSKFNYWVNYWLTNYPPNSTSPLLLELESESNNNNNNNNNNNENKDKSNDILAQSQSQSQSQGAFREIEDKQPFLKRAGTSTQFDIFTGSAGRGQIFLRLYRYTKNETYLKIANEYINHGLSLLPKTESNPSYLEGHIGVYTVKYFYELMLSKPNTTAIDIYKNKIKNVFDLVSQWIIAFYDPSINNGSFTNAYNGNSLLPSISYDMFAGGNDLGLAGLIYTGLLINNIDINNNNDNNDDTFKIDKEYFYNITRYIIDLGIWNGINLYNNRFNSDTALYGFNETIDKIPLMYECPFIKGCYMYGMGHGNGGVMHWMLEVISLYYPELLDKNTNSKSYQYITNTLDYFVKIQLNDGNMPTAVYGNCSASYGNDSDARVQWCHGAPGFIDVFSKASYLYQTVVKDNNLAEKYFNASLKAATSVWERGLLVKGTMIGHGITGNSYMLSLLNRNIIAFEDDLPHYSLSEIKYYGSQSQWRSNQFIEWTLNQVNMDATRCIYSDANESMFAGCPGIIMIYIQAMQKQWPVPDDVCIPAWNYCI